MALTRVTSTVIEDSAVSADKLGNASITTAMIAAGSITADKLGANVATEGGFKRSSHNSSTQAFFAVSTQKIISSSVKG